MTSDTLTGVTSVCTSCVSAPEGPVCLDLNIRRGDDLVMPLTMRDGAGAPIDLTGRSYTAQIRATTDAATALAITVTNTDLPNGLITLSLTDVQTRDNVPRTGVWDLQETDTGGLKSTLIAGKVTAVEDVTRP